jgi:hypothetical protein
MTDGAPLFTIPPCYQWRLRATLAAWKVVLDELIRSGFESLRSVDQRSRGNEDE